TALCLHAGLATELTTDIDSGSGPSPFTWVSAAACFVAALSIPAGLLVARRLAVERVLAQIAIPSLAGAAGQLAWFGLVRIVEGPTGLEYWLWSRVLIHALTGALTGLLVGGARLFRPTEQLAATSGPLDLAMRRLPNRLAVSLVLLVGLAVSGAVRVSAELSENGRFITSRLDDYFLALSNLYRAQDEDLDYPGLYEDLERARRALGGAADFDPKLPRLLNEMCAALEHRQSDEPSHGRFKSAVGAVNQRMISIGEHYFIEPQALNNPSRPLRFLLRYTITGSARYRLEGKGTIPMLRLRRLDQMLIDTPYTGLSYPGLGTVLMDHVDDVALRSYAQLFAPRAVFKREEDGRFGQTRAWLREDRRDALAQALSRRGLSERMPLENLAAVGRRWLHRVDLTGVRRDLNTHATAAYDALIDELALQTEIHEARHAFDGEITLTVPALDELSAARLSNAAAAEMRAQLTEIVDGPLGPRFALAKLSNLVAGEDARANAYFFAGIVVLEGLWGEPIRRPDVVEREGPEGSRHVFLPMNKQSPGWLSYSRIHGAYGDLRELPPDELRQLARELFERLFDEEYKSILRQR
ncbi:MAG: hypothetical protein JRF63_11970, partial [Deltaproteobacteria bacterium]|nr:hypothetical protein [Deltaproteobacteria bacterium]